MLNLRWRNVGSDALKLADSKTGPRAFLFPRYAEARGQSSLIACWRTVCADAKLGSLRLHDLRHTAASQAVMSGEGLSLVGRLLGRHRTTADYAHLADAHLVEAHLVEAAEKIGRVIADAMKEADTELKR